MELKCSETHTSQRRSLLFVTPLDKVSFVLLHKRQFSPLMFHVHEAFMLVMSSIEFTTSSISSAFFLPLHFMTVCCWRNKRRTEHRTDSSADLRFAAVIVRKWSQLDEARLWQAQVLFLRCFTQERDKVRSTCGSGEEQILVSISLIDAAGSWERSQWTSCAVFDNTAPFRSRPSGRVFATQNLSSIDTMYVPDRTISWVPRALTSQYSAQSSAE